MNSIDLEGDGAEAAISARVITDYDKLLRPQSVLIDARNFIKKACKWKYTKSAAIYSGMWGHRSPP
jgi:hypothetical protein